MRERLTALLTKWDAEKGFGFLTLEQKSIFLHANDCAPGYKRPEAGDLFQFKIGQDSRGRTCATNAIPVQVCETGRAIPVRSEPTSAKWSRRPQETRHFPRPGPFPLDLSFLLILLLVVPVLALHKLALHPGVTVVSAIGISVVTYLLYALDKMSAVSGSWRISENTLHFFSLVGGWPGAFVAQQRHRHKTVKISFQIVFWLTVLIWQYVALDSLLNWKMTRFLWQFRSALPAS